MSTEVLIGIIGIVLLFVFLAFRMYIGIAMAFIGFLGVLLLAGDGPAFSILGITPYAEGASYSLSLIPLFVLMGNLAFVSGISTDLYKMAYTWLGRLRGGLAMSTIAACAGFAAICGSSLATGATMGKVSIPEMKTYNYDMRLATGCVAAGGTIGILIPPSIGFAIYGILTEQSIGTLFMAGIFPGIMLSLIFMLGIAVVCRINPKMGPKGPKTSWKEKFVSLKGVWGMLVLFIIVMGGIYFGIFTPSEAGGIGAFGAFLFVIIKGRFSWKVLFDALKETGKTTAMIFIVVIGANIFSSFLGLSRIPMMLATGVAGLAVPKMVILIGIIFIFLILGCVMDAYAIMILTVPILFPVIQTLGFDPIWFGVIMVMVLEVGLITPPVGLNVYVLQGAAPDVKMTTIFKGIIPFLILDLVAIAIIIVLPKIALFLPNLMMGR